jgi:tripartite-type tricarboxylate transporter receptor subunit TctC
MRRRLRAALFLLLLCAGPALQAQSPFPSRPIRLVVGFVPGGLSDVVARLLAPELQKALGQPVIVENKPGAAGIIAGEMVSKSPPDGYTLYVAPNTHLISFAMNPGLPYHAVRSFSPVTLLTTAPNMLVVKADSPYRDLAEFVAAAKAKPGEIAYATSGIGTTVHLAGELFAHAAGITLNHIPYKGANQSVEAVIGGQVPASVSAVSSTLQHIRSGRVRVLGVMSNARSSFLPETPTFPELGYRTVLSDTWIGIIGPAGIPAPIAARLNDELARLLARPDLRERFLAIGNEPVGTGLDEFGAQMARELNLYIDLVRSANIKAQ